MSGASASHTAVSISWLHRPKVFFARYRYLCFANTLTLCNLICRSTILKVAEQRRESWICYEWLRRTAGASFGAARGTFSLLEDQEGNQQENLVIPDFLNALTGVVPEGVGDMASPQQTELAYAWEKYMDCRLQGADLQVGAGAGVIQAQPRLFVWVLTVHFQDYKAVVLGTS